MSSANNNAKFAFWYMLSLVALLFLAIATGQVIFQIINKTIVDTSAMYGNMFNSGTLKFAISALIISIPLYFITVRQIERSLRQGELPRESGIRRWLIYFIIFVSAVVMIVWLMMTISSFLDGELTSKFILKAGTAIVIAGLIFSYYLYDIRRGDIRKKDGVVVSFGIAALIITVGALAAGFFFMETPAEARARNHDIRVLDSFIQLDSALGTHYTQTGRLPDDLESLRETAPYINLDAMKDPATQAPYEYKKIDESTYELCAEFMTNNTSPLSDASQYSYADRWPHAAGYQCLGQKAFNYGIGGEAKPASVR